MTLNESEFRAHVNSTEIPSSSVIICAYTEERWELLVEAVMSSLNQSHRPAQVVVVIDHNPSLYERCLAARDEWNAPGVSEVVIVENRLRRGLGGARTTGTELANGSIVVFLDDDAAGSPTWLEELVQPFNDDDVMMTSGWIIPKWAAGRPQWFPDEFMWVVGCSYEGLPPSGAEIRNPIGASMAIRATIVQEVGDFESRLGRSKTDGNGCEETEYAIRARQIFPDKTVVHAAKSVVHHFVPEERTKLKYFLTRCWREGRSKAILVDIAGRGDSLSAERNYVRAILPRGIVRGLRHVRTWGRSLAIVVGALATATGYTVTRFRLKVMGTA